MCEDESGITLKCVLDADVFQKIKWQIIGKNWIISKIIIFVMIIGISIYETFFFSWFPAVGAVWGILHILLSMRQIDRYLKRTAARFKENTGEEKTEFTFCFEAEGIRIERNEENHQKLSYSVLQRIEWVNDVLLLVTKAKQFIAIPFADVSMEQRQKIQELLKEHAPTIKIKGNIPQ